MKRNEIKLIGMCCVAFLALVASQQLACGQHTPTTNTSCLIQITCDPNSFLSDRNTIQELLYDPDAISSVEDQVSGDSAGGTVWKGTGFSVEVISKDQQSDVLLARLLARLNVSYYSDQTSSTEFVKALVDQLRRNLIKLDEESHQRNLKRLVRLEDRLSKESQNIARKRSDISVLINALRQPSLSPENQESLFLQLHSKRQEIELDVRALGSRIEQLQNKIAESANLSQDVDHDPVVRELIQVVESLEDATKVIESTDKRTGSDKSSPLEIRMEYSAIRTKLFQARADLAKRREELVQRVAGDQLLEMRRILTATEIEHAEAMIKLEFLTDRIERFDLSGSSSNEIERKRRYLKAKEEIHEQLIRRSEELLMAISLHEPPTVTIISLDQNSPTDNLKDESKKSDSSG